MKQSGPLADIARAWRQALIMQWHPKIWLMSILPTLLGMLLWGALIWFGWDSFSAWVDGMVNKWLADAKFDQQTDFWLKFLGGGLLKKIILSLLAMWTILPMMILTTTIIIGLLAMPVITSQVANSDFPDLEKKRGGTLLGSVWVNLKASLQFTVLWLLSLPLCLLPLMSMILHPLLLGWLSYRVMTYDALAEHASVAEREALKNQHRGPLLVIGSIAGIVGSLPGTVLLLGGSLLLPLFAGVAIWLYSLVFIFTGLWFEYYCLHALKRMREPATKADVVVQMEEKDKLLSGSI